MPNKITQNLSLIIAGYILCILDYHQVIYDVYIDLLPDVLGALLVYQGVNFFYREEVPHPQYKTALNVAILGVVFQGLLAFWDFLGDTSTFLWYFVESIGWGLVIVGAIVFCRGMELYCYGKGLRESAERMKVLLWLLILFYAPVAIISWSTLYYYPDYSPYDFNLPNGISFFYAIWIITLSLTPFWYGIYVVRRLKEEMEKPPHLRY